MSDKQPIPPRETRPARMEALSVLPVFLDIREKPAVAAGRGDALVWKVELLAAAGAEVTVYTPEPCADLLRLAAQPPAGRVHIVPRCWQLHDLQDAFIAVGALDGAEAERFTHAARSAGAQVNVVDTPAISTFSFGTIVNRSPVVIGISTSGAAPVLAQSIRAKIEALLHPALAVWATLAQGLRSKLNADMPMGAGRREAWHNFAVRALAARTAPSVSDIADLTTRATPQGGSVALVGAGPGDPELLTLKALRALQSADVVLYDRLVSPAVLELARREARRISVGKMGGGPSCQQEDISALMVKLAREGRRVVRLKGGDPMVFGRATEEIDVCRTGGIPVEIIPGITAAIGAAAELGLPLTDRHFARRLQFVTGQTKDGRPFVNDWRCLADPWATTVFYMGGCAFSKTLPQLLASGLDPDTPALVVVAATTPRKRHMSCRAHQLVEALAQVEAAEPCLIMIGRSLRATCEASDCREFVLRNLAQADKSASSCHVR
jgi:uroporphyrin-III C-methyltransferase/precorrin-2 dehydrogenase/sirohydrochlorin ferrochelatase